MTSNTQSILAIESQALIDEFYRDQMDPNLAALSAANSSLGMWDVDLITKITTWSEHCRKITGLLPKTTVDSNTYRNIVHPDDCLLYTSPSPRDRTRSRMPSSA